ncbi:MAG: Ig-like domain-containing protein, partial [Parcubacteria group bacterium]|nr:Ig-like domain-containing protein [Parcubacteria group bacterium]
IKYTYKSGNDWQTETVGDSEYDYPSLALDSSNRPHISYYDSTNGDLKYTYKSGGTWHSETVDSAGYVGYLNHLALDSSNNPHISYEGFIDDNWSEYLKYATSSSDTTPPTLSSPNIENNATGIAIDSNISFHIADEESDIDTDTLDVTINDDNAIVDGTCQSGYSCDIEQTTSYDITINPNSNFNFLQEVEVAVSVDDNQSNTLTSSWSFTTLNPDGNTSPSGGVYDTRTNGDGDYVFADITPKILTSSGPGQTTRLQAYSKGATDGTNSLLDNDITGLFPDSYLGGAGITPIDYSNNTVLDQFLIFAINNGGPQAKVVGLKEDGSLSSLGQMFVFDSSIRDGLSATSGDFDNDGYQDDAAFCLTGDIAPTVRVYSDVSGIDNWNLINEFQAPFGNVGCNLGTFQYDTEADEILVTPNHGPAEPKVYIYTVGGTLKKDFWAYDAPINQGISSTGIGERIYTTPNNGSSQVNAFDSAGERKNFWWVYEQHVRGDFSIRSGQLDTDDSQELLISPVGSNGPHILGYNPSGIQKPTPNFFAFGDETLRNGVGIAVVENWHGIN